MTAWPVLAARMAAVVALLFRVFGAVDLGGKVDEYRVITPLCGSSSRVVDHIGHVLGRGAGVQVLTELLCSGGKRLVVVDGVSGGVTSQGIQEPLVVIVSAAAERECDTYGQHSDRDPFSFHRCL